MLAVLEGLGGIEARGRGASLTPVSEICTCGFSEFIELAAHHPQCRYRVLAHVEIDRVIDEIGAEGGILYERRGGATIPDGDDYMTESSLEAKAEDEEGTNIPDSAGPIRDEEYFEHGHSSPHNPPVERREYPATTMKDELAELTGSVQIDANAKLNLLCPHCKRVGEGPVGEDGPEWDALEAEQVVEIHPDAKYALILPRGAAEDDARKIVRQLSEWWDGEIESPIIVIAGEGFRLVRVDRKMGPELMDCGSGYCPGHVVGDGTCKDFEDEVDGDFAGQDYHCEEVSGGRV